MPCTMQQKKPQLKPLKDYVLLYDRHGKARAYPIQYWQDHGSPQSVEAMQLEITRRNTAGKR